jgi:hypothetical protein
MLPSGVLDLKGDGSLRVNVEIYCFSELIKKMIYVYRVRVQFGINWHWMYVLTCMYTRTSKWYVNVHHEETDVMGDGYR